jgi:hypothetical protein
MRWQLLEALSTIMTINLNALTRTPHRKWKASHKTDGTCSTATKFPNHLPAVKQLCSQLMHGLLKTPLTGAFHLTTKNRSSIGYSITMAAKIPQKTS